MKTWLAGLVGTGLLGICVLATSATVGMAQQSTRQRGEQDSPKRVTVRLPRFFAQIGLDSEEKASVRKVVADFDKKLAALQDEIETLQEERMVECEKMLSKEQLSRLDELRTAAAEARRKRSANSSRSNGGRSNEGRSNGRGDKDDSGESDTLDNK